MNHQLAARISGLCSIVAGLLHVSIVAKLHWTPFPPLEGMFFIFGGILQCALGVQFLRQPVMRTYKQGLALNGGMAMLCLIMQYLPVPFVGEPEAMGSLALTVVSFELIAVGTSLRWLHTHKHHSVGRRPHTTLATALSVMSLWGLAYYGSAHGVSLLMPDRSVGHHHGAEGHLPPSITETGDPHGDSDVHEDDHSEDEGDDHGH